MTFDYNKLKILDLVIQEGSFSQTAIRIGRTQSAVSQSISSLENELGFKLLERYKGRIYPTDKGKELHDQISKFFEKLDQGLIEVLMGEKHKFSKIRLGVSAEIYEFFVVHRIGSFLKDHPGFHLETTLDCDENLEKLLMLGELDVAIITQFQNRDFFEVKKFASFEEHLVAHPSYLVDKKIKNIEDALLLKLYDYTLDFNCIATWLKKNDKALLPKLQAKEPCQVIKDHRLTQMLLETAGGVAMMPDFLLKDQVLTKLFPRSRPTQVGVDIAVRKTSNLNTTEKKFIESLRYDRS
jgi:DNA-binding transcriptional LysR family regulator